MTAPLCVCVCVCLSFIVIVVKESTFLGPEERPWRCLLGEHLRMQHLRVTSAWRLLLLTGYVDFCDTVTAQSEAWQTFISGRIVRVSGDGCRDGVSLGKCLRLGAVAVGAGEFFVMEAVLCIVRYLAASLVLDASSSLPQLLQPTTSPAVTKCPLGAKITPTWVPQLRTPSLVWVPPRHTSWAFWLLILRVSFRCSGFRMASSSQGCLSHQVSAFCFCNPTSSVSVKIHFYVETPSALTFPSCFPLVP